MRCAFVYAAAVVAVCACACVHAMPAITPEERAKQLLAKMTVDEKITMLHGAKGDYVGNVPANTRLGIPALTLNDGMW